MATRSRGLRELNLYSDGAEDFFLGGDSDLLTAVSNYITVHSLEKMLFLLTVTPNPVRFAHDERGVAVIW